ncbi:ABC transporter substrate-binding protein [Labrys monachus]|uniref:Thiamine pyrimidine synthase n=1 Tax=Labrys monachus TaxID=217067 RepID=A0ABU0FIC7_9HYPH|nr:ABC transporter substrate-binding protein [Labrys monachus]MDQ0394361.1 NitT/TauT family transport system substrate-binding protein [Labrys monachus]
MSLRLPGLVAAAAAFAALAASPAAAEDTLRLEWIIQGQFAGELIALDKGYYKAAGADIKLLPAGSDIKPAVTVAQGSDTFGIGHPNQVIMARSHGAPLVMISQHGQKSAQVYIARKDAGITKLADVRGKKIGSWFGGDEAEFMAMLNTLKMTPDDVQLQPQQDNPVPQLISGQLDVIEAVRYAPADLAVLFTKFKPEDLTYLYPEDAGVALVNTGLFTSEKTIAERPELVQAVVDATLQGWKEALDDPEAAAKVVVKYNPELKVEDQVAMIKAMGDMFCAGPTLEGKFGQSTPEEWQTVQTVLLSYGKTNPDGLHDPVDLSKAYTNVFWDKAPAASKTIKCSK